MAIATAPSAPAELSLPENKTLLTIESIVAECGLINSAAGSHFVRAVKMAAGIKALRQVMTEKFLVDYVMPLQGSRLGFKTDKDRDGGYSAIIVRDCAIECLLRGGNLTGNEFNIIAGNTYFTKEFFERAVGEIPGLTDLKTMAGVPVNAPGGEGALVPYVATWKMNGQQQTMDCRKSKLEDGTDFEGRIAVRMNKGSGADQILGKAKRKMLARIYQEATGSNITEGDVDEARAVGQAAPKSLSDLTSKLTNGNGNGAGATTEAPVAETPVGYGGTADESADGPKLSTDESQVEQQQTTTDAATAADIEDMFNMLNIKLDEADSIGAVTQAEAWAKQGGLPEEVNLRVTELCAQAKAAIRAKRGTGQGG